MSRSELLASNGTGAGVGINGTVPVKWHPIKVEGSVITHEEPAVTATLVTGPDVHSQQHAILNKIVIVNSYQIQTMTILIIVILYWFPVHHITSASTQCPDDQSLVSCFSFFILQEPSSKKTLALCLQTANSLLCSRDGFELNYIYMK